MIGASVRLIARLVGKPSAIGRAASLISLRLAESLFRLFSEEAAADIAAIRKSSLKSAVAEGQLAEANAQKRVAEAIVAHQRARVVPPTPTTVAAAEKRVRAARARIARSGGKVNLTSLSKAQLAAQNLIGAAKPVQKAGSAKAQSALTRRGSRPKVVGDLAKIIKRKKR